MYETHCIMGLILQKALIEYLVLILPLRAARMLLFHGGVSVRSQCCLVEGASPVLQILLS